MVPFQHPIVLGVLCAAGLVLALDGWGMASPRQRLMIAAAAVLTLCALLLSGSRTGLLATLAAVPISLVTVHLRVRIAVLAAAALAVPVGLWQYDLLQERWSDAWQELGQWRESSETSVVGEWSHPRGWDVGAQRPWTGQGYGAYGRRFRRIIPFAPSPRDSQAIVRSAQSAQQLGQRCADWVVGVVLLLGLCGSSVPMVLRSESIHQSSALVYWRFGGTRLF